MATTKEKGLATLSEAALASLDGIHEALKPIADRSAHYDVRQLATIVMRLVETLRGDKEQTQIPSRHHP